MTLRQIIKRMRSHGLSRTKVVNYLHSVGKKTIEVNEMLDEFKIKRVNGPRFWSITKNRTKLTLEVNKIWFKSLP